MNTINRYLNQCFSNPPNNVLALQNKVLDVQKMREANNYNVANNTIKSTVDAINNKYHELNPSMTMDEVKSMDMGDKLKHVPEHLRTRYKKQKRRQNLKTIGRMIASSAIYMGLGKAATGALNAVRTIKGQ